MDNEQKTRVINQIGIGLLLFALSFGIKSLDWIEQMLGVIAVVNALSLLREENPKAGPVCNLGVLALVLIAVTEVLSMTVLRESKPFWLAAVPIAAMWMTCGALPLVLQPASKKFFIGVNAVFAVSIISALCYAQTMSWISILLTLAALGGTALYLRELQRIIKKEDSE